MFEPLKYERSGRLKRPTKFMKMKRILASILAATAAVSCLAVAAFADAPEITTQVVSIDADNPPASQNAVINLSVSAAYYVTIPQTISAETAEDIAYDIKVYGDVSDEDQVTVTPSATIVFAKTGSSDQVTDITITQAKTSWLGTAIFEATDTTNIDANKASGTVGVSAKADEFTAGEWTSTVAFVIAFIDN